MPDNIYLNELEGVAKDDVDALRLAEKSYGNSWKKRGGVGAYMMLARKIDRIEMQAKKSGYDIFQAVAVDNRPEGLIDDIRDLRRYLMLVEAELRASGRCPGKLAKDIEEGCASKGGTSRDLTNVMPGGICTDALLAKKEENFLIHLGSHPVISYNMSAAIGMKLVKYVRQTLGESVLSEVKLANGIPLHCPMKTQEKYIAFITGIAEKVIEAYSAGHFQMLLDGFCGAEADDTPPASVLHPR